MDELGTGVLDWNSGERISDRYGTVMLFDQSEKNQKLVTLRKSSVGRHGRLIAVVRETRDSTHAGDWFHGIYRSRPTVGEEIVLGEGLPFFFGDFIGLLPDDRRQRSWLGIHALYRAHHQTVTLFFDESNDG